MDVFLCKANYSPYSYYSYYIKPRKKMNNEVFAAIAMALHDAQGYNMHDGESGILTITQHDTEWASKQAKITQLR